MIIKCWSFQVFLILYHFPYQLSATPLLSKYLSADDGSKRRKEEKKEERGGEENKGEKMVI